MSHILSIARNTFREAVRDRVLYNLVIFVLLIVACAILLGDLSDGHEARTIVNIGLNAMLVFGTFIAIFVGVSLVSKEIEKRTVYAIFSKPVSRGEFIVGKYLGLSATLLINTVIMGIGVTVALLYVRGGELAYSIWGGIFLIFLELTLTTAVAILFSSFSTPALSALLTFSIFIIGHLSASLRDLAANLESKAAIFVFDVIYYVLPNLSLFSFRTESANGMTPSVIMLLSAVVYTILYAAVLQTLTVVVFKLRNFK